MPHILIVEDEPATSWALAEGLSDDGYTIDTFGSAEEACAWLRKGRSDLVISDLVLPGMSGLDLARRLRRGRRRALPVIIVTAYSGPESSAVLGEAGVADWFLKPFRIDQLRRSVRRAIENGVAHPESEKSSKPVNGSSPRRTRRTRESAR